MAIRRTWVALWVGIMCMAGAAHAAGPSLEANLGGTFGSSDEPKSGGFSTALSALWSAEPVWFGPTLFVDDLGTRLGRLEDPNDQTDLGAVQELHRVSFGGAWRVDVPVRIAPKWPAYVGAAAGIYRIRDSQLGVVQQEFSATGVSVAAGLRRSVGKAMLLGASARFHRVFDNRQNDYACATIDLIWLAGASKGSTKAQGKTPGGGN